MADLKPYDVSDADYKALNARISEAEAYTRLLIAARDGRICPVDMETWTRTWLVTPWDPRWTK